jgi:glycosyltransferase involved in cell wall biosynthesis
MVEYRENIEEQNLPSFYNAADICLIPSLYEGFGLPALEAMSCGTPTIVGNVSSLPEIVGDAALKIDPYSIEKIYKTIARLINDKNLQAELKENGIARAKKFDWNNTADQVAKHYARFID